MTGPTPRPGSEHQPLGDPDQPYEPTTRDIRPQRQAEKIRDSVRRMHYHQHTSVEQAGAYMSHSHDDDGLGHVHPPRRVFPLRPDGGYLEETGPSLGTEAPEALKAHVTEVLARFLLRESAPDQLMRWRLRLFCGHLVEATAHISYESVDRAFHGSHACPECGLDPAVIVAARPLGLLPKNPRSSELNRTPPGSSTPPMCP